ncbi:AAA family ATPase [Actinomadura barringtoniae]|uniref:AAA family ATPase n=1 Tax=Actinomadura barringtoniae TaxID=1427535 RepID=A0A939PA28_9ACTN|nr:LuxR family transcriptional regulator [Actinomadura barringtoniae]MBO2448618.1 AAA family ATPase [Actinomadura barringtoniae]
MPGIQGRARTAPLPGTRSATSHRQRGRENEWCSVLAFLDRVAAGEQGSLLVEGGRGMGRTTLHAEIVRAANERGVQVAAGRSFELGHLIPLEPLLTALGEVSEPGDEAGLVERLSDHLAERAAARPVLINLDDLQWADPFTLAVLRALNERLEDARVSWVISRATPRDDSALLFDALERRGGERITLGPLGTAAQVDVVVDALGAKPGEGLRELIATAGGNPYLLTELLAGLMEEDMVDVHSGRADLTGHALPVRAHVLPARARAAALHVLDHLSPAARRLTSVAAVFGRSFSFADFADLVGETPSSLLPALEEASDLGVLSADGEEVSFQYELMWWAACDAVPAATRWALHQQIGELLLSQGDSTAAGEHLAEAARQGNERALAGLDRAAAQASISAPRTGAKLAMRALALTPRARPKRAGRVLAAAKAVAAAGRLDTAADLAHAAENEPMPVAAAARLRCARARILSLSGCAEEAEGAVEAVLADPDIGGELRDEAELCLLTLGLDGADPDGGIRAEQILGDRASYGDGLVGGALLRLALDAWNAGRLDEGLAKAKEAVMVSGQASPDDCTIPPRLVLAIMLNEVGPVQEAHAAPIGFGDGVSAHRLWTPFRHLLQAGMLLATGSLGPAKAEATLAVTRSRVLGNRLLEAAALPLLATAGLRMGDLDGAALELRPGLPLTRAKTMLAMARATEAKDGPAQALTEHVDVWDRLEEHEGLLVGDVTAAPWLARVALAADDAQRAGHAAAVAERLAKGNLGFPGLAVTATHARGLLDSDMEALRRASAGHRDPWAKASAEEDIGVLIGFGPGAVKSLEAAQAGFTEVGAERDAARLRRRLRRLGVRHRHWKRDDRPATGWESLTETESKVAELVAEGLTNQESADRLFLSVHTVAFHLRQIYRKLGIGSRVELARLAPESHARSRNGS